MRPSAAQVPLAFALLRSVAQHQTASHHFTQFAHLGRLTAGASRLLCELELGSLRFGLQGIPLRPNIGFFASLASLVTLKFIIFTNVDHFLPLMLSLVAKT